MSDNGTTTTVPVPGQFAMRSADTPAALAVADTRTAWNYGQLARAAAELADRLVAAGLRPGEGAAVLLPKSAELLAAYLGVWRAGGYALLLDPGWPTERIRAAIRQLGPRLLVAGRPGAKLETPCHLPVVWIGPGDLDAAAVPAPRPGRRLHPDALAYVVFTSGSTGVPKGVGVTHRSVTHCAWTHRVAHRIEGTDRSAWLAPAGTSSAVGEIWPYLVSGAAVLVPPADTTASPTALQRWMLEQSVTTAYVSMPLAEQLYRLPWPTGAPLRLMTVGSDAVRLWPEASLPFEVAVSFGSAEANGISSGLVPWEDRLTSRTASDKHRQSRPPVGRPWPDVSVRVTTPELTPAGPGEVGELLVASPELATGYVGDPRATAVRFVPDPQAAGTRLYRTGDLCALRPDGYLVHHGRLDRQIKVRGFRVNPAEVERELVRDPGVADAVVVSEPDRWGRRSLTAYLVCDPRLSAGRLRRAVADVLPDYAVPTRWVRLHELPRNASGKVQRDQLAKSAGRDLAGAIAPQPHGADDALLTAIVGIWRAELKAPAAGPDDDFFDLGGDSLCAAAVVEALAEELDLKLRLRDVYTHPTPRRLRDRAHQLSGPAGDPSEEHRRRFP
jgi:amino acid adenylation domain-containing protein